MNYIDFMFSHDYKLHGPVNSQISSLCESKKEPVMIATQGKYGVIEKLAEINKDLLLLNYSDEDEKMIAERKGFFLGRAYELTSELDEHPQWWVNVCNCHECQSCG